jgi:putative acetyltransferase
MTGVHLRAQRPGELADVREVITRAFGRPVVVELAEALQRRPATESFVAEVDGRIAGHVQLSRGWVDAAERLVEVLVLSPLSVVPEAQRQGVGGALVRHALAAAEHGGAPAVFLEGSPDYYGRFGFERASALGFGAPSVRVPDGGFQVARLPAYEPWMTGALVYNDVFWAFDLVGLRPDSAV